jgi:hypothetical protein
MNIIIKWFRNRQRVNRRLACAKIGWVALLLVACCMGCEPEEPWSDVAPTFCKGEVVQLVLGGDVQIVDAYQGKEGPYYRVSMLTSVGLERFYVQEYELYLPLQGRLEVKVIQ